MGALRAVLFDMDGTLTDSEKLWTIALEDVAAELGGVLSAPTRAAMVGQDMWTSIDLLQGDTGTDADPRWVAERLTARTAELFAEGMPWRPGAQQLLADVRDAGLATALVTATYRSLVDLALSGTLGAENFDAVVCGDEVERTKPDPEPYLQALRLLGLQAQDAIAVEDSPNGSASALAAGPAVLVVPCDTPVPPRPGMVLADSLLDVSVDRLREIHAAALVTSR